MEWKEFMKKEEEKKKLGQGKEKGHLTGTPNSIECYLSLQKNPMKL